MVVFFLLRFCSDNLHSNLGLLPGQGFCPILCQPSDRVPSTCSDLTTDRYPLVGVLNFLSLPDSSVLRTPITYCWSRFELPPGDLSLPVDSGIEATQWVGLYPSSGLCRTFLLLPSISSLAGKTLKVLRVVMNFALKLPTCQRSSWILYFNCNPTKTHSLWRQHNRDTVLSRCWTRQLPSPARHRGA